MRTLVVIPTYNERESLPGVLTRLRASAPAVDVLIVDDNSPDGTGALADELAAADPQLFVLHRPGKAGLGTAYRAGFRWGRERDYEALVEMDADGSHHPEQVTRLLDRLESPSPADLVIGARYVPGGAVHNWPRRREVLSRGANLYAKLLLGMPLHDATAGYRAYRSRVFDVIDLDQVTSQGYSFQVELAWRTVNAGFAVAEVPIDFTERALGASKMSRAVVIEAVTQVARWGVEKRLSPSSYTKVRDAKRSVVAKIPGRTSK